ncbi:MAG: hypothetical protein L3J39_16935 [Verrucomicrobiales bacterium]|nr:hypothetical protein [Verrucomicrobiales bacterium]
MTEEDIHAKSKGEQEKGVVPANSERVLVVHHAGPTLRLIREALQAFTQAEVDTTPDALYGFEMALKRPYKLFIFCLSLPSIDGELLYELVDKAYGHCHAGVRATPAVIYIVEKGQNMQHQELMRDARVRGLLSKPLNIDRLLKLVGDAGLTTRAKD